MTINLPNQGELNLPSPLTVLHATYSSAERFNLARDCSFLGAHTREHLQTCAPLQIPIEQCRPKNADGESTIITVCNVQM